MDEKERDQTIMEGNLLECPIFSMERRKVSERSMEKKWLIRDAKGNVTREEIFRVETTRGIPNVFDLDVFNAIMKIYLTQRGQYPKSEVHFTVYQIAKELGILWGSDKGGMGIGGKSIKRIKESLLKMVGTVLHFENSFYMSNEKVTRAVHLIDNFEYYEKKKGNKMLVNVIKLRLDDEVVGSIDRNYFKLIDFKIYKSLSPGLPRRLYEYLEKKKYQKNRFEIGVKKLAERIPLKTKQIHKIKGFLDKAHEELVNHGVIDRWEYKKSNIIYYFRKSDRFKAVERDLFFLEGLVTKFYETIGQVKTSNVLIHDGIEVLRGLVNEGYSEEDIQYTLGWVVDNIKDIRSINIIPRVIGQALSDKESKRLMEEREARKKARAEEKDKKRIEAVRRDESLDEEFKKLKKAERDEIERVAMDNLLKKGHKREFIIKPVLAGERNRILEERLNKVLNA